MSDVVKKSVAVPEGPDFSDIDSEAKAEARSYAGDLEKLLLLPLDFGGTDDSRNVAFVPRGFAAIKARIDMDIIKPLISTGNVTEYRAIPEYIGRSHIPVAIRIVASNPGSFAMELNIWGKALRNKYDA